ncbi:MAG TPA: class I SAM-dependent methyltransferase [Rhizomicrobium sp.]|jgi:hypothetical protein|nr:class I SAM-dependent methyltransferase [Rhizomicrobium sp.]
MHNESARRINRLARMLAAQNYLEIGVQRGRTFCFVNIPEKIAVDPAFKFDTSARPGNEQFFSLTSDEWFTQFAHGKLFDVIFIDGLHEFGQAFRDFCNSFFVSHPRTIWLIDDTIPSDIYSAWPDERQSVELRRNELERIVGTKVPKRWSGDVFKLVIAIHDYFPLLSYCTIMDGGKPQTVVWRQARPKFEPLVGSLEAVSRLTYFEFRKNIAAFNGMSEDEAFRTLANVLDHTCVETHA